MPRDPRKYLQDIVSCCAFVIEFAHDRSIENYKRDRGFRSAVERELQVIGEAVMQLARGTPDIAAKITEYESIIGFRHVLVHGYDSLDANTVWDVVENKLDQLKSEAESLLDGLNGSDSFNEDRI